MAAAVFRQGGPSESVIQPRPHEVKLQVAEHAVGGVWRANESGAGEVIIRRPQIDVKVFGLDRPISGKHPFNAGAGRPADVIFLGRRSCRDQTTRDDIRHKQVCLALPESDTTRCVEQKIIHCDARPGAGCSEPIQPAVDRPIDVAGSCIEAPVAFEVRPRRIGFKSKNEGVDLIVESDLPPCEPAIAVDRSTGRVEDLDWATPWIEGEVAFPSSPGIAAVNAGIQTGPADGLYGRNGRGCFAWKIGRHCGRRQRAKSEREPQGAHNYLQCVAANLKICERAELSIKTGRANRNYSARCIPATLDIALS